jgi:AcrR family transcriptional regulator
VTSTPSAPAKRLPRAVRERQMLDAAVQVFSAHGYHGASMDEVAELAGVSKPLLYLYLGSKEKIFSACIAREADRLVDTIGAAVRAEVADPGERLWLGLAAFFGFVADHRASWTVLYQQGRALSGDVAEQLGRVRGEIIATVTELVLQSLPARGGGPGYATQRRDAAAIAYAVVGAADAMAEWALTTPGEEPTATARRLMNLLWVGMERNAAGERYPTSP